MSDFPKTKNTMVTKATVSVSAPRPPNAEIEVNKTTLWLKSQLPLIRRMSLDEEYRKKASKNLS